MHDAPASKVASGIRREQIAAAALALVNRGGLRALSMAAVARGVGLVPSALYRHFRSKRELLDALLEVIDERLAQGAAEARRQYDDPLQRLQSMLERHIRLIQANSAIPRIVFSEEVIGGSAQRRRRLYSIIESVLARVADTIREGQRYGLIRAELKPETAALVFLGLIQPAAIVWHLSDGALDLTRHADEAWNLFRELLTGRPLLATDTR
jgi:AcrR family transcriptional regulator